MRRPATGFTLIEVMIAITLLAMISLIAWRGLDSMSRTTTALQLSAEESTRLMHALQQLERDVALRTTVELPPDTPATLLPVGMLASRGDPAGIQLSWVRAAPAAPGRWQRVRWWLQSGTLYRAAGAAVPVFPLPEPLATDRVAVLGSVESFEVRAWEPGQGWQRLPVAGGTRSAASSLEVTLALRRNDGAPRRYRQVIPLE